MHNHNKELLREHIRKGKEYKLDLSNIHDTNKKPIKKGKATNWCISLFKN